MSAQSKAKASQGYIPKPVPAQCSNCEFIRSSRLLPAWMQEANAKAAPGRPAPYSLAQNGLEKELRCGVGGFAVKKTATCIAFVVKTDTVESTPATQGEQHDK